MSTPHTWLTVDLKLGPLRMPLNISVRMDDTVLLTIGSKHPQDAHSAVLSADELEDLIKFLQIAHSALQPEEPTTDDC